ncbi:MAG: 16S rRNA (guanine(527)-N(7))-methyltransferase RsmG [Thiohalocapsa sp.]|nr:16S rRNA (guanine(527)-N(7))-methyltransferase RsmG [Thiohalocapsa sp.]MCF7990251.1 16S rRNA (guanine(527)-N(7))-methyltransferase RsmG [Thiohalocapsa sp.]
MSASNVNTRVDAAPLRRRLDLGLAQMDTSIADALDGDARDRLIAFVLLLERWNRSFNLTAVRDPADMVPRHLLDSLSVLPWLRRGPVLDAGTGAGLPGIPLAIALPGLDFTLLDSNGKKTRFVRQAVMALGLGNVQVVQSRLEAYRPEQKFATIVARAVASLAALRDACAHLGATDARLLALKGRLADQELAGLVGTTARSPIDAVTRAPAGFSSGADANRTPGDMPEKIADGIRVHPLRVPLLEGERSLIELPLQADGYG